MVPIIVAGYRHGLKWGLVAIITVVGVVVGAIVYFGTKIASRKNAVVFTFKASSSEDKFKIDIAQLVKKYGTKIKFSAGIKPMITLDIGTSSERKVLNDTTEFVKYLLG